MINVQELEKKLEPILEHNHDTDVLDYIILLVRDDVLKIMRDMQALAGEESVNIVLYQVTIKNLLQELEDNIIDIVKMYNSFSEEPLETIRVEINAWEPSDGPIVTPVFKE